MMFTYEHALSMLIYCHAFLVFSAIPIWGYWALHRSVMQHRKLNADTYRRELEAETQETQYSSENYWKWKRMESDHHVKCYGVSTY